MIYVIFVMTDKGTLSFLTGCILCKLSNQNHQQPSDTNEDKVLPGNYTK